MKKDDAEYEAFHADKVRVRELCDRIEARDLPGVRAMLADGCPTANKRVRNSLALAIARAEDADGWAIVDALRDAGATATADEITEGLKTALRAGRIHAVEQCRARGYIAQPELDELICTVATSGQGDMVLRMLELGAHPSAKPKDLFGSMYTALELAAHSCAPEVATAMAARLTQQEKDEQLLKAVKDGRIYAIPALLEAGANAAQTVKGRSLLELAPTKSMDIKRVLRAHKTATAITSAMPEHESTGNTRPAGGSFVL